VEKDWKREIKKERKKQHSTGKERNNKDRTTEMTQTRNKVRKNRSKQTEKIWERR
jgi:hypothetical protein